MNKRFGFTLVELLAVIVVLAIILAVAIPSIVGVIKSSTKGAFKSDAAMLLEAIENKKLENRNFDPTSITKENMNSILGLNSDNYDQLNISVSGNTTSVLIVGKDKWAGLTAYGTAKTMKVVNSEDYDVTPPAITIIGDNPQDIGRGSTYVDAGATANDIKDGDVSISSTVIKNASNEVVSSVDTSIFMAYTITYTAIDSKGNSTSSTRIVNVVDKTDPNITIVGSNPININIGSTYSDAGATALDDADGDITSKIITTGTVNPNVMGAYSITYSVSDNNGNAATATRTVNVIDQNAPVITLLGANPQTVYTTGTYADAGATALDDVDGNLTSRIVTTGTVNPNVVGTYTITYNVTDNSNNNALTVTRTVNVVSNIYLYNYTGNYQTFTAPENGTYIFELWGSKGGGAAGYGAYTKGTITLSKGSILYVYVGQKGAVGTFGINATATVGAGAVATFNGGGAGGIAGGGSYPYSSYSGGSSGGGATDIRLQSGLWNDATSLKSRIMIAGGGGGVNNTDAGYDNDKSNAGGLNGEKGGLYAFFIGKPIYDSDIDKRGVGGTQTTGYAFGIGGTGDNSGLTTYCNGHSGGGGGYYGGTGGRQTGGNCPKMLCRLLWGHFYILKKP
jgi:prepilin-type N-terminal cleavage/methylation domain-containing protein